MLRFLFSIASKPTVDGCWEEERRYTQGLAFRDLPNLYVEYFSLLLITGLHT